MADKIKVGNYMYTEEEIKEACHAVLHKNPKAISDLLRKKAPRINFTDFCAETKALGVYCSSHLIKA